MTYAPVVQLRSSGPLLAAIVAVCASRVLCASVSVDGPHGGSEGSRSHAARPTLASQPRRPPRNTTDLSCPSPIAMPEIHRDFTVCDLTTQTEDGRYKARAAVMPLGGSRTLFQRFLDFEMFDTKAEATARAHAGARAWIDEELRHVSIALLNQSRARYR